MFENKLDGISKSDNQFVGTTVQDDIVFGLENIGMPRAD